MKSIAIEVEPAFFPSRSEPDEAKYFFTYTITISNNGTQPVQLISRNWLILDSNQKKQEVSGAGVVGQQPHIEPGDNFTYTSGAVIETPVGTMEGSYIMMDDQGAQFEVPIKPFLLALPGIIH